MNNLTYKPEVIQEFLSFLSGGNLHYTHTFVFLDAHSKEVLKGMGNEHLDIDGLLAQLKRFSEQKPPYTDYTVHVTLNEVKPGSHKHRIEDMESARVLCVDLDSWQEWAAIEKLIEEYRPDMVVRSSIQGVLFAGYRTPEQLAEQDRVALAKYHVYWKIDETIGLADWKRYQQGLAHCFKNLGADASLSDVQKTIRVPGIERVQKDGTKYDPEILYRSQENRKVISNGTITVLFPNIIEDSEKAAKTKRKHNLKIRGLAIDIKRRKTQGFNLKNLNITKVTEGTRNDVLYDLITNEIACLYPDELEPRYPDLAEAQEINHEFCEPPLEEREVASILQSACKGGLRMWEHKRDAILMDKESVDILTKANGNVTNGNISNTNSETKKKPSFPYNYNTPALSAAKFGELACVERVIQKYEKCLLRIGKKTIYAYNDPEQTSLIEDTFWETQDGKQLLDQYVRDCANDIMLEHDFETYFGLLRDGTLSQDKINKAKIHFTSAHFIQGCVRQVCVSSAIKRFDINDFDKEPNCLLCCNGLLDMNTGNIRRARPEDYLLKKTHVVYDATAKCPQWEQFLAEIFDSDIEMLDYMPEMFGYSLTGSIDEQKIFVHHGNGANGKSKVLECLAHLAGNYHTHLACDTLAKSKNGLQKEIERIGAQIEGNRVLIIDDLETRTQWNEGFLKNLTSESIVSRKLYAEKIDIPNRAKVHIGCNERPKTESDSDATVRRLEIIPYPHTFVASGVKEKEIKKMIKDEASGILNWAIRGLKSLTARGKWLQPLCMQDAIGSYKKENFVMEALVRSLFEPGVITDEPQSIETLKDCVNHHKDLKRIRRDDITEDKLGAIFRAMGCPEPKRLNTGPGKKTRFHYVKYRAHDVI